MAALLLPLGLLWAAPSQELLLWPAGAPGSEGQTEPELGRVTALGEYVATRVHHPSLTPYLPAKEKANGTAVLVIPGGGHRELWLDHEGRHAARALSEHGTAAFVLKYRLARTTNSPYQIVPHALADTQRALRLIRSRATEWRLDPARVGALGFSAGGELVWLASARFDTGKTDSADLIERQGSRPDFLGFVYPGRSGDIQPGTNSPPAFLAAASNDRQDISEGLAEVYLRFRRAGVPAELHLYGSGGHGFGVRAQKSPTPAGQWLVRFEEWMGASGFLKAP
jgi:endo-1,4-beta-xylanase